MSSVQKFLWVIAKTICWTEPKAQKYIKCFEEVWLGPQSLLWTLEWTISKVHYSLSTLWTCVITEQTIPLPKPKPKDTLSIMNHSKADPVIKMAYLIMKADESDMFTWCKANVVIESITRNQEEHKTFTNPSTQMHGLKLQGSVPSTKILHEITGCSSCSVCQQSENGGLRSENPIHSPESAHIRNQKRQHTISVPLWGYLSSQP